MGYERLEKKSDGHDQRGTGKTGISKRSHPVILSPVLSESLFFDVQEGEEQMLHRLQHLPETWQEKTRGCRCDGKKKSVSVFIFRNREVYMSMSMKKPDEFIRELVELVGRHGCTMQEIPGTVL